MGHTAVCSHHNFYSSNLVPDILHIQWDREFYGWVPFSQKEDKIKLGLIEERLVWFKKQGSTIIFTLYEKIPQDEDQTFEKKVFNLIAEYADIITHLCEASLRISERAFPVINSKTNIIVGPGNFLSSYEEILKESAREKLKIPENKFVILNFERQQNPANEKFINDVFNLCRIKRKYLLAAGDFNYNFYVHIKKYWEKLKNSLRERNKFSKKKCIFRLIHEREIPYILSAPDLIFIGSTDETDPGIFSLAATYGKPIIYPNTGWFDEQARKWVGISYEPGKVKEAAGAITNLYNDINQVYENLNKESWLIENSWERFAETILGEINNLKDKLK